MRRKNRETWRLDLVPMFPNKGKVSLSCKALCQSHQFKERFKVLKQISGRIEWTIRRWYRYCSTCGIWLRMRSWGLCQCCNRKVRVSLQKNREAARRWYAKNKAAKASYYQKNKERILAQQRQHYHETKKNLPSL